MLRHGVSVILKIRYIRICNEDENLFSPTRLGPYTLKNRVVLPPLTRSRSSQPGDIPNELMAEYYAQRSSAGFMVTEGTQIEPRGQGYAWTPGIYSSRQVEGWKKVTRAVHEKKASFLPSSGMSEEYPITPCSHVTPRLSLRRRYRQGKTLRYSSKPGRERVRWLPLPAPAHWKRGN